MQPALARPRLVVVPSPPPSPPSSPPLFGRASPASPLVLRCVGNAFRSTCASVPALWPVAVAVRVWALAVVWPVVVVLRLG
eukprot:10591468-Prorocentrum_lima.AAC.1